MSGHHDVERGHHGWHLTWMGSDQLLARRVAQPVARFLRIEAASGILMLLGTVVALVWFNVAAHSYESFWNTELAIELGGFHLDLTLHEWVNDGLMALFFFVVGMEIKREMVSGELRDPKAAALPIIAAVGGMVVPALIYTAFNFGGEGANGWGIPMATDIAFAVGVVSLLGSRVPVQLKLFLLTLAVTDDLGGIAVIAIFYSDGLLFGWLAGAVGVFVAMYVLRRLGVWFFPVYVVLGAVAWYCMLESGVHATIAGVVIGFLTPTKPLRPGLAAEQIADRLENQPELTAADVKNASFLIKESVPVDERLMNLLHPWTSFLIIPIFALANAAIPLNGDALSEAAGSSVTWGVLLGLLVGKTVGISLLSWLAIKLGLARMPRGATPLHIVGIAIAAAIGFTVAIFITGISFTELNLQEDAKVGIFVASIAAAVVSTVVLMSAHRRASPSEQALEEREEAELFAEEIPEVVAPA
jgi:NhaA family Na+:H+ antiporter